MTDKPQSLWEQLDHHFEKEIGGFYTQHDQIRFLCDKIDILTFEVHKLKRHVSELEKNQRGDDE